MNKLKIHIIAIILVALAIAGTFYILSQDKSEVPIEQEQETTVQQPEEQTLPPEEATTPTTEEPTVSEQPKEQPLSEEELTALWANGERCPENIFFRTPVLEDLVENERGISIFVNIIEVRFDSTVTCEDVERIAVLLDATIEDYGRNSRKSTSPRSYEFKIPTRTLAEQEVAVQKVKDLNSPKIRKVYGVPYVVFLDP